VLDGLSLEDTVSVRARVLSADELKNAGIVIDRNVVGAPGAPATTGVLRALSKRIAAHRLNADSGKAALEVKAADGAVLKPTKQPLPRK
jgi:hypothetical protein